MKYNTHKLVIITLSILFLFTSCEDVIEIDVPDSRPRLIIDAIVRVDEEEAFTEVKVIVKETNSFFEELPPATLEQITLLNVDNPSTGGGGETPVLDEIGPGVYSKFFSTQELMEDTHLLQIRYQGELFLAQTKFVPAVPIDNVTQGDGTIFDEDDTEVIVTFTDLGGRDDYYLFDFGFGNFLTTSDEFYQGQTFQFSYFYDEEIAPGDELVVSILGVDEPFFSYMDKVIDQSEGDFGPFETPSVTVRGNFINATNIDNNGTFDNTGDVDNFALGYFAIVQEFKSSIIIE
ncbi:MAG: DUF4249 family protein [Bacteroidota bacterium]